MAEMVLIKVDKGKKISVRGKQSLGSYIRKVKMVTIGFDWQTD